MPSVTIDAEVLAAPPGIATADDTHAYIDTLLDWCKLLDEPWVAIYMSENASEALLEDGLYPIRKHLKSLFYNHGIKEYDVNTVSQVVDRLLRLTPSFETYFKIRNVLTENLSTDPDILRLSSGKSLRSDLERCVVLVSILRQCCSMSVRDHSLILRKALKKSINVKVLIHVLEHNRNDLPALSTLPMVFKGDVLVCDNFHGLIDCLDESDILQSSVDDLELETAIRIALYKSRLNHGKEPDWDDVNSLRIGHKLHETVKKLCATQGSSFPLKVLRAITETLDEINVAAAHALRTGPGGGNPQRKRGADKAMRRDIDREFRLHYWLCDDGLVEIASVVTHNDFSIPE